VPTKVPARDSSPRAPWSTRWNQLARALGIRPQEKLLLALSGGADSVLLLHWLAAAEPGVPLRAVHVDHGLRGAESAADARFCASLCHSLGVPFALRRAELDPDGPSLEARARRARYRHVFDEARRSGHGTILTGHHADDALETLLFRWVRGSTLAGLRGPRADWQPRRPGSPLRVVRPLLHLRREEVRLLLTDRGLRWREDSSNRDFAFTRNRIRHGFLPLVERIGGAEGLENLRAFGRAVEALEERFATATAHLSWRPAPYAAASRGPTQRELGGVLERGALLELPSPLRRRALWRLLLEGTGLAPTAGTLAEVLEDLRTGRCTRRALRGDWHLLLRSGELHLLPPKHLLGPARPTPNRSTPLLPFPVPGGRRPGGERHVLDPRAELALGVPGIVTLVDGRRISAELLRRAPDAPPPHGGREVELDAAHLGQQLAIRWPEPGDRFHALGAPGAKPLARYLADRGVPREERARIPLVYAGDELLWVCGLEPGERRRVAPSTRQRLRLTLHP